LAVCEAASGVDTPGIVNQDEKMTNDEWGQGALSVESSFVIPARMLQFGNKCLGA